MVSGVLFDVRLRQTILSRSNVHIQVFNWWLLFGLQMNLSFHVCPVPPVLSVPRVEYTAVLGQPVSLECVADGQPQPEVSWQKERQPVVDGAHMRLFANGTLVITSTLRSDAGLYTCTAKNVAGRASQDMRLVIQGGLQ